MTSSTAPTAIIIPSGFFLFIFLETRAMDVDGSWWCKGVCFGVIYEILSSIQHAYQMWEIKGSEKSFPFCSDRPYSLISTILQPGGRTN